MVLALHSKSLELLVRLKCANSEQCQETFIWPRFFYIFQFTFVCGSILTVLPVLGNVSDTLEDARLLHNLLVLQCIAYIRKPSPDLNELDKFVPLGVYVRIFCGMFEELSFTSLPASLRWKQDNYQNQLRWKRSARLMHMLVSNLINVALGGSGSELRMKVETPPR